MERHFIVFPFFIAQYSNILQTSFFTSSCCCSIYKRETLTFINTNGRPDMLNRKALNEKFIQEQYILLE